MSASDILKAAGLDVPEAVDAYLAHAFTRLGVATDICLADEALEALAREVVRWKQHADSHQSDLTEFVFDWFNERDPDAVAEAIARYEQEAKPVKCEARP